MASILLEIGQSNDGNLVNLNGTIDRVINSGPAAVRRASVSGLAGFRPKRKASRS
jgi:hypothetical protein